MIWIELDRSADVTLTQQLYHQVVSLILRRELKAGTRLPSTRELSAHVGVSRNVVLEVFEQLAMEGYLEARQGSGTYVAELALSPINEQRIEEVRQKTNAKANNDCITFACGLPDLVRFPRERWLRCGREVGYNASKELWGYGPPFGCESLRESIRQHLALSKGIVCGIEQIVITGGSSHGLTVLAMAMRKEKIGAIIEDPAVDFVGTILSGTGHPIETVPVDTEGLVVEALPTKPRAGLLVVSPAHQFPLGGTLSIQRRLALIEYARNRDLFIVEDDYDSEFRYAGAPVSPLYRIDPCRSIHMGSFSKTLAPSVRLGYLVIPQDLVPLVRTTMKQSHMSVSPYVQATLARFMEKGYFRRHVSRMKRIYERKMRLLVLSLERHFGNTVIVSGHTTGLNLTATFRDVEFSDLLRNDLRTTWNVDFDAVHDYYREVVAPGDTLALGFGNLSQNELVAAVERLKAGLEAWESDRIGHVGIAADPIPK